MSLILLDSGAATTTKTASTDAVIQARFTITAATSAVIQNTTVGQTLVADTNAVIQAAQVRTSSTNAVIQAAQSRTATTNAVIQAALTRTASTNAVIQAAQVRTSSANAVIRAAFTRAASTDAVITGNFKLASTNAVVQAALTKTSGTDAAIASLIPRSKTANTNAVIATTGTAPIRDVVGLTLGQAFLRIMLKPAPTPQQFATLFAKAYEGYAKTVTPTPVLQGRRQLMEKGLLVAFGSAGSPATATSGIVNAFSLFWLGTPVVGGSVTAFLGQPVMQAQLMATFRGPNKSQTELALKLAKILVAGTHTVQYVVGASPPAFLV